MKDIKWPLFQEKTNAYLRNVFGVRLNLLFIYFQAMTFVYGRNTFHEMSTRTKTNIVFTKSRLHVFEHLTRNFFLQNDCKLK